jgi:radical S-adenosyl methionine domain-containing protein 2
VKNAGKIKPTIMKNFETVSFHIVKPCNMSCKFCYATFDDFRLHTQLTVPEIEIILDKLKASGVEKITFAGGEPMLYKKLEEIIIYAKKIGLVTSIITNGSLLTVEFLERMQPHLDWIGLSIDSLNQKTNIKIGRVSKHILSYKTIISQINKFGYKLKINTVVNKYNQKELLSDFITKSGCIRWKVFDTLKVVGQNHKQFNGIKSTQFNSFVENNKNPVMVVENNDLMTGSYLLVDPRGKLFENSIGRHIYSRSLLENTFEECLSDINLNRDKFIERGGLYSW